MRKFLSSFDLFPASPILRANGQAQVVNLCGSIFSIIIFALFTYIFINSIISTVKLEQIIATEYSKIITGDEKRITNITVGVGFQLDQLTLKRNIFQVRAFLVNEHMIPTEIGTFPCQRDMWPGFTDQQYLNLGLKYHMCVQKEGVEVFGEFGTSKMGMLQVGLYTCDNASSPVTCASPADINAYFAGNMIMGRFMAGSFVILDTGLNPTSQNPYTYRAYQKTLWMLFNQDQLIMGQVFLGNYQLTTDTNFLPFESKSTQSGYYVSQAIATSMINPSHLPIYVQLYLIASPVVRVIDRQYGKFDTVLSYVGGLYGIVVGFIGIFLVSFNQYRYQLRVSQGAFVFRDGHMAREENLHFGKYLKYVAYDWIKTFCCCQPNWQDCKAIDQARQQANQQIDVKHLLKRISHLQKLLSTLINGQQQALLFMSESTTLSQLKHRRNIVEYCQKFTTGEFSLTMTTIDQLNAVVSMGLSLGGGGSMVGSGRGKELASVMPMENSQNDIKGGDGDDGMEEGDGEEGDSLGLMQEYLKKYEDKFQINNMSLELSQQDLKIEQELMQAFYNAEQSHRRSLIKKIPLGILYRLKMCKQKNEKNRQMSTLHLQSTIMGGGGNYKGGQGKNNSIGGQQLFSSSTVLGQLKNNRRKGKKKINVQYIQK